MNWLKLPEKESTFLSMSKQKPIRLFVPERFRQCHQRVARRMAWPYSFENDILMRWRANILASILMTGIVAGLFAYAAAAVLIIRQNAWELALVDTLALGLCLVFLSVRSIRYEVRAGISVLMFYVIGMAIVLSVGPMSGGPAWLFAFAVIAGVLMGNRDALAAIIINALTIGILGWLMTTGRWGQTFVLFPSTQAMIAAGVNFVCLNTLTAVGVATLVQGLSELFQDRQAAQKTLLENQKMALVGQIAGKMAHDFNNVLGIIMGTAEMAQMDCPHEPTRKSLKLIFDQTLRGKNLTRNLVAFAKNQEPKLEYVKVQEKIDLVLILLKKDLDGIDVRTEYATDLPLLAADPGMIEHALVNLLQNAVHAVSLSPAPRIIIRAGREKLWVVIEIQDNGCGIPPEYLDRVFEPAFTLKGSKDAGRAYEPGIKGTGYGMANVKRYIEQHRGTIDIQSAPEKGTTVRIGLPVTDNPAVQEKTEDSGMEMDAFVTGKQILVVEDEPAISNVLSRLLTLAPCRHKVDIAEDGKAALDCLARGSYDLVSLDYLLPGRRNGMDIYRHIRKHHSTLPVLFMSGNIQFLESIRLLKKNDPHLDHVAKPCQGEDYLRCVNQLLRTEGNSRCVE
jgi:signal transduction histidine kinase